MTRSSDETAPPLVDSSGGTAYLRRPMTTPTRHARLMELFDEACDLPRPDIKVWLANLTGFDEGLREELAAMLEVDERAEVFHTRGGESLLARDLLNSAVANAPPLPDEKTKTKTPTPTPTRLGEYEVLEKIGAGGMGSVYRARQTTPERIVALKTLHPWLVSASSLERFRFEAQALASLTHPGIPPVYAVGQQDGLLYFAMELVEGPPLTKYVKNAAFDVRARVELLARVADAVHHAHLRGFVHRDLKPDNIRVPADGQPRVLDFGIAAGLGSRRAEVAGTPSYMSPEQFDPVAGVDVRTDVYALGVMLFELLTGQLPIVPHSAAPATLRELKQQTAPKLSAMSVKLGNELDAIVARALEVRVERRYGSAAELSDELRRWLRREPVQAVGGGRWYRFTRFVTRNRALVALLSLLALALITGAGVSFGFYLETKRALAKAELEASRAKSSVEFLASVLNEADSDNAGGRGATIGQALDHAVEKLEKDELDPSVETFLRASLANTYVGLGEWQHAKTQALAGLSAYEKGQLPEDEQLAEVLRVVSEVLVETGEMAKGKEAAERSLELELKFHGEVPHDHTAYSLHVAAIARRFSNDFAGAVELHRRAIVMERALLASTGNSYLNDALEQLTLTLVTWGKYPDARIPVTESLASNIAKFGREHQVTAISLAHLGWLEVNEGNYDAARKIFTEVNSTRRKLLGPDHMRYAQGLHNLADVEILDGKPEVAGPLLEECLAVAKKAFGEETGRYAWLELMRVDVLLGAGEKVKALELVERDLALIEAQYGVEREPFIQGMIAKAKALRANGREDEAKLAKARAMEVAAKVYGDAQPLSRRTADAL